MEHKLRKALGMGSHEGSIDEKEKLLSPASPRTDTRNSGESYNADLGARNAGLSDDRDLQRMLPVHKNSATAAPLENQTAVHMDDNGDEYEMRETRTS